MRRIKTTAVATASALMLAFAPAAYAQGTSDLAYPQPGGVVQQQVSGGGGNNATPTSPAKAEASPAAAKESQGESGKLPFTGLDVALIVGAGGVLMLLGFGIRRLTRAPEIA